MCILIGTSNRPQCTPWACEAKWMAQTRRGPWPTSSGLCHISNSCILPFMWKEHTLNMCWAAGTGIKTPQQQHNSGPKPLLFIAQAGTQTDQNTALTLQLKAPECQWLQNLGFHAEANDVASKNTRKTWQAHEVTDLEGLVEKKTLRCGKFSVLFWSLSERLKFWYLSGAHNFFAKYITAIVF